MTALAYHDLAREHLLAYAARETWAILPEWLDAVLARPVLPHVAQDDLLAARQSNHKFGRVARLPILGLISKRNSFWSFFFGGTSIEGIRAALRELQGDETIDTVLLDIDSPGGTASGLTELAGDIRRVAEKKHIVALANNLAASAAYWIASQADEVIATPDAMVGSIGVFTVHDDYSKRLEQLGIKPTYIHAGKYKVEGNPDEPLSEEARQHIQSLVEATYGLFVADVARGRSVSTATVRSDYGEGRVLTPKHAQAAGMIDRIAGFDETVRRLTGMKSDELIDPPQAGEAHQAQLAYMRRQLELAEKE